MNYQELYNISKTKIKILSSVIPQNSFDLAFSLNIRVKNSVEFKKDFPDNNLFNNCNALYGLYNGEYTIYYDEKHCYKNFSVAHEIAHHLLKHTSDGPVQHHDANLLAAILVAPPKLIQRNKIRSSVQLASKCLIPVEVATEYWKCLTKEKHSLNSKVFQVGKLSILVLLIMSNFYTITYFKKTDCLTDSLSNTTSSVTEITFLPTSSVTDNVIVTLSGARYHKSNCFYINNKTNVIHILTKEAEFAGYTPCKHCFN